MEPETVTLGEQVTVNEAPDWALDLKPVEVLAIDVWLCEVIVA